MKILLDTNIIIDFLSAREPFGEDARSIVALVENKEVEGFLSASSVTTIHYLSIKLFNKKKADSIILELLDIFDITSISKETFLKALKTGGKDFEDSVIYSSALLCNIDIIISRDKKGFTKSSVLTLSPKEFLSSFHFS